MRRAARAGVLLCGLVLLVAACGGDAPTSTAEPQPPAESRVHPRGIVDKVDAPLPWGVAVRDDGLALFTQLANGGVGITNTKTRTVDGFIPTGLTPTGIALSPDGNTAYVANQFGNVSRIDVATRQVTGFVDIGIPSGAATLARRLAAVRGDDRHGGGDRGCRDPVHRQDRRRRFRPNGFAVHPGGRLLYVSSFDDGHGE